eukprot:1980734-Pyramimonas_sp.AAC.1
MDYGVRSLVDGGHPKTHHIEAVGQRGGPYNDIIGVSYRIYPKEYTCGCMKPPITPKQLASEEAPAGACTPTPPHTLYGPTKTFRALVDEYNISG